jgi:hypothetical protein
VRGLALLPLLALCACEPKPAPAPTSLALDCAQGYAALARQIDQKPGIKPAHQEPGEPYRFYSEADGSASYMVTMPGAPGHPAILKQVIQGGAKVNSGCPYGDPTGYQQLLAYLASLSAAAPEKAP